MKIPKHTTALILVVKASSAANIILWSWCIKLHAVFGFRYTYVPFWIETGWWILAAAGQGQPKKDKAECNNFWMHLRDSK